MSAYDDSFGSTLVATWIESLLFSVVLSQAISYYQSFPKDHTVLKVLVAILLVLVTVSLVADYASTYLYVITFWGNIEATSKQYWPLPVNMITTAIIATLANGFLTSRFYKLSHNIFVTLFLILLILLSFASGLSVIAVFQVLDFSIDARPKIIIFGSLWIASNAITDLAISLGLLWQLSRMRTTDRRTQNIIYKLIGGILRTGMAAALIAILMAIIYLINYKSNLPTALFYQQSQLYTLSLLHNLNIRQQIRDEQPTTLESRTNTSDRYLTENTRPILTDIELSSYSMNGTGQGTTTSADKKYDGVCETGVIVHHL